MNLSTNIILILLELD